MPSSIPHIAQRILSRLFPQRSGSLRLLLLRQLPVVGATILPLVAMLTPCATSWAQSMQTDPITTAASTSHSRDAIRKTLLRQPLHFEPNSDGGMSSRAPGRELRIDSGGRMQFGESGKPAVSLLLQGANPGAEPTGQDLLAGKSN